MRIVHSNLRCVVIVKMFPYLDDWHIWITEHVSYIEKFDYVSWTMWDPLFLNPSYQTRDCFLNFENWRLCFLWVFLIKHTACIPLSSQQRLENVQHLETKHIFIKSTDKSIPSESSSSNRTTFIFLASSLSFSAAFLFFAAAALPLPSRMFHPNPAPSEFLQTPT